jgi:WD40 repeat protein
MVMPVANFGQAQPGPDRKPVVDALGDPLPEGAFARLGTTRFRHNGRELLGFTADGRSLIYFGSSGIHFMDPGSGKETKFIAIGDGPRGGRNRRFPNAMSSTLSADGKVAAVVQLSGNGAVISVVEIETGKERRRLTAADIFKNGQQFFQPSLQLSGDGKHLLVSAGMQGEILPLAWVDTNTGERVQQIDPPNNNCSFSNARFAREGREIITLEIDNQNGIRRLRVFDAVRGTEIRNVAAGNNNMISFELQPDNKTLLASDGGGGQLRLYDHTGKELKELSAFQDALGGGFAISRDGKQLFVVGDGVVVQYEVDTGKEIRKLTAPPLKSADNFVGGNPPGQDALAISRDGKTLAASGSRGFMTFDIESGQARAGDVGNAIGALLFAPANAGLLTLDSEYVVQQWDTKSAKVTRKFTRPDPANPGQRFIGIDFISLFMGNIMLSDDGKLLAATQDPGGVGVWETDKAKFRKLYASEENDDNQPGIDTVPASFAFAPGGHLLATGLSNGTIKLWDTDKGEALRSWAWQKQANPINPFNGRGDSGLVSLGFSPDGKTLAGGAITSLGDNLPEASLILWETATGKERLHLRFAGIEGFGDNNDLGLLFGVMDQLALSIRFSPDGKQLVLGCLSSVHVVDALTGKDVMTYSSRLMHGKTAVFSPDGKLLLAGCADGSIRILDAANGRTVRDLPAHSEPVLTLALSADGKTLASGSNDSTVLLWDMAAISKPVSVDKTTPTARELQTLWRSLGDADAGKAYQAMGQLAATPKEATALLKEHLKPIKPADPKLVEQLLEDLNSQKYSVREKANVELEKLGELALKALRERLAAKPSLEMRQRIDKLLAKLNGPVESPEMLQGLRAVETLERIGSSEAAEVLATMAKGAAGHRVTEDARAAWQRLERLAKSQ